MIGWSLEDFEGADEAFEEEVEWDDAAEFMTGQFQEAGFQTMEEKMAEMEQMYDTTMA